MSSNSNYYSDASSDDGSGDGEYSSYSANTLPAHMLEPALESLDLSVYYTNTRIASDGGDVDLHCSYSDMEDDEDAEELVGEHTDDLTALYASATTTAVIGDTHQHQEEVSESASATNTLLSPPRTSSQDCQKKQESHAVTTQQDVPKAPFLSLPLPLSSTDDIVRKTGLQGSQPISVINPPRLFRGGEEFAKSQKNEGGVDVASKNRVDFASSGKVKANNTMDAYYSDMSDEDVGDGNRDEHLLSSQGEHLDINNSSGGNVNYAALFPEAESEMRSAMFIRNSRLEVKKDELIGGRNQDYLQLAKIYSEQRQYADDMQHPPCVLCNQNICSHVFFPCEHRCVCAACIEKNDFCEDRDIPNRSDGYNMCPLCATVIKKILPFEAGLEVIKYWEWVEEVSPPLPPGFKRKFKRSEDVLYRVYVEKDPLSSIEDSFCKQS